MAIAHEAMACLHSIVEVILKMALWMSVNVIDQTDVGMLILSY